MMREAKKELKSFVSNFLSHPNIYPPLQIPPYPCHTHTFSTQLRFFCCQHETSDFLLERCDRLRGQWTHTGRENALRGRQQVRFRGVPSQRKALSSRRSNECNRLFLSPHLTLFPLFVPFSFTCFSFRSF